MPTEIYDYDTIFTLDDEEIYITPLKIKYLKLVMKEFEKMAFAEDEIASISVVASCCLIAMKQYCPDIKTIDMLEDKFDVKTLYRILDIGAGIMIDPEKDIESEDVVEDTVSGENSWENLDLAKLEAEVFLLGIWRDYEHLESSLSMPELTITLETKRDMDYQDKKFTASLKGIDLDESNNSEGDAWERLKARVTSRGATENPNDILSFQGIKANQAGFGIGMGLEYEKD